MVTATLVVLLPILVLEAAGPMLMLPILELLARVFFMAASAAVVVIASGAYLGTEVGAGQAIRQVGRRFLSVLGSAVFQSLLISLGLLLHDGAVLRLAHPQGSLRRGRSHGAAGPGGRGAGHLTRRAGTENGGVPAGTPPLCVRPC